MGFLDRLFGRRRSASGQGDRNGWYIYVECEKCGSPVQSRIDLINDLSLDDDGSYVVRKTLVDSRCFRRIEATLRFDSRRNPTHHEVAGGRMISQEEYLKLTENRS